MTVVSPTSIIRSALSNRTDVALSALEGRTCHSWKMNLDRSSVLARNADFAGHPSFHLFLKKGTGARVADQDGNCFIDLSMGCGAQLLGHGAQAVKDAIIDQMTQGWHTGLASAQELELAHRIQAASGANERVAFCNSGADAAAYALRAARAFTGRDLVVTFGSAHSAAPAGFASPGPARRSAIESFGLFARPAQRKPLHHTGVPQAVLDTAMTLTYGNAASFEHLRRRRREIAAVIVEPVPAFAPSFDHAGWLRELASICGENGIAFILDERLTGFRLAYGGAQERMGLMADLAVYGETIGGGLPLGAVAGRADILEANGLREATLDPLSDAGAVSLISISAGAATLDELMTRRATLYPTLDDKTRLLAQTFNAFTQENSLPAQLCFAGSVFRILFGHPDPAAPRRSVGPAAEAAFNALVLSKGVMMHSSRVGFLSAAHTASDIAQVSAAFQEALLDVKIDGLFDPKA